MLELIKGFVNRVISDPRDIVKSNAEILVIRHPSGERSVVNSYPAGTLICVRALLILVQALTHSSEQDVAWIGR